MRKSTPTPFGTTTGTILTLAAAALLLSGCGTGGGLLNRSRPDEFAVQRQAPLVVPPDFALTPPKPGAPRPSDSTASQQSLDALFGGSAPRSEVERNAVSRAGGAAPGIRSSVGDPATNTVAKGEVTRDILSAPQGDGREAQAVTTG
ncbi:MAG: DUF3035 domain-containing protein [Pseudomonadota bacterium]